MACASCGRNKKSNNYVQINAMQIPPFGANDSILVYQNKTEKLNSANWDLNRHKVILFYANFNNEIFQNDINKFEAWKNAFNDINADLVISSTEPIGNFNDIFQDNQYHALSSYILPLRLNLINDGIVKDSSIIITTTNEVINIETLPGVSRNISDLHRILYSFINGESFSETWVNPVE